VSAGPATSEARVTRLRQAAAAWTDDFDLVIEPTTGLGSLKAGELVRYRELLFFLTLRDIKVRYKQTALGVAWAILQPVLAMILFTVVFGHVAKIDTGGVPYPIFAYAALVPWLFFSNAVQLSATSLTVNPQLITKIYFPRLYLVASPILAGAVDLALSCIVLFAMMAWYGVAPELLGVIVFPLLLLLAFGATVGLSAWLAALNVKYRDIRFVVPFLVQSLLFITPVVYSIAGIAQPWQTLFGLNPMTTVVEGFRWTFAGGAAPSAGTIGLSVLAGLVLFASGYVYFHRTEKSFADLI
jgi:lipopolysaccharide transport system permease protein